MFSASKIWAGGWLVLAAGLITAGCGAKRVSADAPKTVADWFPIRVGTQTVRMQLAVYPAEMQRGLMERRDLDADEGMLFVYARPQQMSFWMHDTPTPLDIGFFQPDGTLAEIYAMQPYDESVTASRGRDLQFALEMNQGWFQARGVALGAQLDLAAVRAALVARGLKSEDFGLK